MSKFSMGLALDPYTVTASIRAGLPRSTRIQGSSELGVSTHSPARLVLPSWTHVMTLPANILDTATSQSWSKFEPHAVTRLAQPDESGSAAGVPVGAGAGVGAGVEGTGVVLVATSQFTPV